MEKDPHKKGRRLTPNQEKKQRLEDEFENIVSSTNFDPKQHFPTKEDIPGIGENQQVYDYQADMDNCREKATQMVKALIKLHLGDDPKVINDPMVVEKMEEDIEAYTNLKFMVKQNQRLYITNLTNIDNGQVGANMTEAISALQKEQRDTLKMLSQKFKDIDTSYRMLKDVFLAVVLPDETEEKTTIMDLKKMNNTIDDFMKERTEQRLLEKQIDQEKAEVARRLTEKTIEAEDNNPDVEP